MIKDGLKLIDMLVGAMRQQASEARTSKAEVDISGGVDSAVVAALACRAFGKDNVIGVYSSINSSAESCQLAGLVADKFGFKLLKLDLSDAYRQIVMAIATEFGRLGIPFPDQNDPRQRTAFGGLRSCLRAPVGRFVNRAFGGIREGTGNRDEDELIRFFQKGGDGEVDSNWIEGLFKGEVWELAAYLGVPQEIIDVAPTPDLWGGTVHTDEGELKELTGVSLTYTRPGGPMGTIEWASRENARNGCVTRSGSNPGCMGYNEAQSTIILAMRKLERSSRHKTCMPPCLPRERLLKAGVVE